MEDKKLTDPIDIPTKNQEKEKLESSPSNGWSWPWGKPPEKKLDLTPENVKAQVTDPNVLHHIAVGENIQRLKKEREEEEREEEREECEQDTDDEDENETDEESDDFEEPEKKMSHCEKLEEYGEELGYALHEFKLSIELDFKNLYDDLIHAPQHIKLFLGAGLSTYFEIFPQTAVAFLVITTLNGIIEAEVDKRLREHTNWKTTILVEDKNVCTNLDDVDGDSDKCDDCDCNANSEEKECV